MLKLANLISSYKKVEDMEIVFKIKCNLAGAISLEIYYREQMD